MIADVPGELAVPVSEAVKMKSALAVRPAVAATSLVMVNSHFLLYHVLSWQASVKELDRQNLYAVSSGFCLNLLLLHRAVLCCAVLCCAVL